MLFFGLLSMIALIAASIWLISFYDTKEPKYLFGFLIHCVSTLFLYSVGYVTYFVLVNPKQGDCHELSTTDDEDMCWDVGFEMATFCLALYSAMGIGSIADFGAAKFYQHPN